MTRPSQIDVQHAAGLPFRDPRVMAVLAAVVVFTQLLAGFDNPALVRAVTTLLGSPCTSRQATYVLRRLKRKGLIVRLPGHHRYQLTPLGRRVAVLFTAGRRRGPGMTGLALHKCRVDTVFDEVRNVGVAQAVRREIVRQARTSPVDGESLVDLA
nr:hypothetical protein [Mycobacterium sp.]